MELYRLESVKANASVIAGVVLALILGAVYAVGGVERTLAALGEEPAGAPIRWRGGFDCAATYEQRDVVFLKGSSYIARDAISDCVQPPEPPWELLIRGGETGTRGSTGPAGVQGPPGSFGGAFQSPDGKFRVQVTDSGITLLGADASVTLTATSVDVSAQTKVSVKSSGTLTVSGSGPVAVTAPMLSLGGTSCMPVARLGSLVTGVVGAQVIGPGQVIPAGPIQGGMIVNGSPSVSAC